MRLLRPHLILGLTTLGALAAAHVAGCGGDSSTSNASASTGSGGMTGSSTSGGGKGGSGGTGGTGGSVVSCGDGKIEGSEACDLGAANGTGVGCSSSCDFDCKSDGDCNVGSNACAGTATCTAATVQGQMVKACQAGTPLADGASCGTDLFCVGGNCKAPVCGDGVVEAPEECDDGNTTAGDGCESNCKFSCLASDPTRNCASTNVCVTNGTCGATHTCTAGTNVNDGTTCPNGTCKSGVCTASSCTGAAACMACNTGTAVGFCDGSPQACNASTCGDGCVDATKGEECDPPNGTTCSATCKLSTAAAVCGNGTLEAGEQCDDGNLLDLDGCDSSCKYEAVARMTSVAIESSAAPTGCTPTTNRLGAQSITALAIGQLNTPLQTDVTNGTVNVFMQFLKLSDLTGTAASGFTIGILDGAPDPAKGTWPAAGNPQDWWFLADPGSVSMGLPTGLFTTTSLAAHNLTAGPNDVSVTLNLGGSLAQLSMRDAHMFATINGSPAPNAPPPPPAQVAAGLVVYQTITANGNGQGLCGNITVESLAKIPVPQVLAQGGGTTACGACSGSQQYTYCGAGNPVGPSCNSLLDVLVGGCKVVSCLVTAVNPEQPDVSATSGGTVKTLTLGSGNKVPDSVTTGNDDAYSAYLKFNANRVHFTGESCAANMDCQTGQTCTAGVCK